MHILDQRYTSLRELARRLASCTEPEVPKVFKTLLESVEQLFAIEHQLMEEVCFPALQCHCEQHARVLAGLHRAHSHLMNGGASQGRYAGAYLLMNWFELHNSTLDACLAVWVECTQSGLITQPTVFLQHPPPAATDPAARVSVPPASGLVESHGRTEDSGQNGERPRE
jgi:hemerythrin